LATEVESESLGRQDPKKLTLKHFAEAELLERELLSSA
jgi:hypothetical protein